MDNKAIICVILSNLKSALSLFLSFYNENMKIDYHFENLLYFNIYAVFR